MNILERAIMYFENRIKREDIMGAGDCAVFRIAIAALREKLEREKREKGCEYCRDGRSVCENCKFARDCVIGACINNVCHDAGGYNYAPKARCCFCGRKLTEDVT